MVHTMFLDRAWHRKVIPRDSIVRKHNMYQPKRPPRPAAGQHGSTLAAARCRQTNATLPAPFLATSLTQTRAGAADRPIDAPPRPVVARAARTAWLERWAPCVIPAFLPRFAPPALFHCGPRPGVCVDRRVGSSPHTPAYRMCEGHRPGTLPAAHTHCLRCPPSSRSELDKSVEIDDLTSREDHPTRPRRRAVVRPATLPRPGPAFARRRPPTQSSGRRAQAGRCGGCLPGTEAVPLCPTGRAPTPTKSFLGPG